MTEPTVLLTIMVVGEQTAGWHVETKKHRWSPVTES